MKVYSFKGGFFPREMKDLTNSIPIYKAFPHSKTVTIPVTMGGAPNSPLIKVGDYVKKGQKISDGNQLFNCPVHASIAGKVIDIKDCLVTGNNKTPCIIIESDNSDAKEFMPVLDPFVCTPDKILERIREAGIVGMGGACFPAHVKLNPPEDKEIEYVLLNAAECEPYLTCDERTLQENAQTVIDGLAIVLHLLGASGIIALETNKAYIKPILEKEIEKKGYGDDICIKLVKTKYPQGSEKFIVKACLGVEIPSGKLPSDVGCVICNVETVCAISDAFRLGEPLIERTVTISGTKITNPGNYRVPVGTLVSDLRPQYFNIDGRYLCKVISGGPMMGFAMESEDFPIIKGTSGITYLTKEETYIPQETNCINCGRCIKICPMHLAPVLMKNEIKNENYLKARKFGLKDCIECGCCAYICPASIPLVQEFRKGKQALCNLSTNKGVK